MSTNSQHEEKSQHEKKGKALWEFRAEESLHLQDQEDFPEEVPWTGRGAKDTPERRTTCAKVQRLEQSSLCRRTHQLPTNIPGGQPHATNLPPFSKRFLCIDRVLGQEPGTQPKSQQDHPPKLCIIFLSEKWDHFLLAPHGSFGVHGCGLQARFVPATLTIE